MKKYITRAIFLIIIFFLVMAFSGCTKYYSPEKYANPKRKYEVERRKVY